MDERLSVARLRLEIDKDASWADVNEAYRRLSLIHHPDKSNSPNSTKIMQDLNKAKMVLKRHYAPVESGSSGGSASGEEAGGSTSNEAASNEEEEDGEEDGEEDEAANNEGQEDGEEDGEGHDFESDEESTTSTSAVAPVTSVWKRMAGNIATAQLDDERNVQLIIDGMRTEEARSRKGDSPIKVRGDVPDWKALALATLQRASDPVSDEAFEQAWSASTVRAQGCEVLIQLSCESDAQKHDIICRDEVFSGVDGTFYQRTALSEYELAMHAVLTHAHKIVVIMQPKDVDGYMLWDCSQWSHETRQSSSALDSIVMSASHSLLTDLHDHHANGLKRANEESPQDENQVKKAEKRSNASRQALARYGNRQNRDVVQLILNIKKRMAVSTAEDPFDKNKHLLPFSNGVMDLITSEFRPIRKDDYVLRTTGKEWHPPSAEKVAFMRRLFESMLPHEGPRKTVYSMLRLSLGAVPAERFWMLTGSGRNGKGLIMGWLCYLLGKELSAETMPMAMLTQPLAGTGPTPEVRKAHRCRVLNWSETPDKDEDEQPTSRKPELKLLLSNIKFLTAESSMPARDCRSNDSQCELWGTAVLQCNSPPKVVGKIDDAALERFVMIDFPFTFTSDADKLRSNPAKYKPIDTSLKSDAFKKGHYCALVQLLLDECPDGSLFIAPECKQAAGAYLGEQDTLQCFLHEHCEREETAPVRQWLGVKEMLAKYNDVMGSKVKEKEFKEKLKSHQATSADYKEKGQATLSDTPLRRNTANGLLNWRLKASEVDAEVGGASVSKRPRVA